MPCDFTEKIFSHGNLIFDMSRPSKELRAVDVSPNDFIRNVTNKTGPGRGEGREGVRSHKTGKEGVKKHKNELQKERWGDKLEIYMKVVKSGDKLQGVRGDNCRWVERSNGGAVCRNNDQRVKMPSRCLYSCS